MPWEVHTCPPACIRSELLSATSLFLHWTRGLNCITQQARLPFTHSDPVGGSSSVSHQIKLTSLSDGKTLLLLKGQQQGPLEQPQASYWSLKMTQALSLCSVGTENPVPGDKCKQETVSIGQQNSESEKSRSQGRGSGAGRLLYIRSV